MLLWVWVLVVSWGASVGVGVGVGGVVPSLTKRPEAVVTGRAVASAVRGVFTADSTVDGRFDWSQQRQYNSNANHECIQMQRWQ